MDFQSDVAELFIVKVRLCQHVVRMALRCTDDCLIDNTILSCESDRSVL